MGVAEIVENVENGAVDKSQQTMNSRVAVGRILNKFQLLKSLEID